MFVDLNKAGNSNTTERLDLLSKFNEVFGFHRVNSLMADREFIGVKWFNTLNKNKGAVLDNTKKCYKGTYEKESIKQS